MCLILDDNKDDVMSLGADSAERDDSASDTEVEYWFPSPQLFIKLDFIFYPFKYVHAPDFVKYHQFQFSDSDEDQYIVAPVGNAHASIRPVLYMHLILSVFS